MSTAINILKPARYPDESYPDYRARRVTVGRTIRGLLMGHYATHAKDGSPYVQGPHRSHQPHVVELPGPGEETITFKRDHGTLMKGKA
jgi:hypothetical protein